MDKKHKKTLFIIVAAVIIVASGIAYAYFRATVTRTNQTITTSTGTLRLTLLDAGATGYGEVIHFGETRRTTFQIENTGTLDASVNIYWKNLINTYLEGSLKYTLKYGDESTEEANYEVGVTNGNVPISPTASSNKLLMGNLLIPADTTYNFTLDITLIDSPEVDQTADLNAHFSSEFTITEYKSAASKTLAALGLANSVSTFEPDFSEISPNIDGEGVNTYKCYHDNVQAYDVTSEQECSELYEIVYEEYSTEYQSIMDFNNMLASENGSMEYLGEATWDGTSCTYNGTSPIQVFDNPQSPKPVTEKICTDAYNLSFGNENQYIVTGIKQVTGQWITRTQDSGIYSMEDDQGISYYFRGNITNNYVKFGKYSNDYGIYTNFYNNVSQYPSLATCEEEYGVGKCQADTDNSKAGADMYWRIVRINGDGSLRLIYDGTSVHANNDESVDRLALRVVPWNDEEKDAKYVGYMYGGAPGVASTSREEAQKNETNSNIKKILDAWYEENLKDTIYENMIADEIFCNDRSTAPSGTQWGFQDTGLGFGENTTYYGAANRIEREYQPSFKCPQKNDAFTVNPNNGNGSLTYPIGLITADEINAAGGKNGNPNYYLYRNVNIWSLSPYDFRSIYTTIKGGIKAEHSAMSVDPVINISAEYVRQLKGDGTAQNPYHFD